MIVFADGFDQYGTDVNHMAGIYGAFDAVHCQLDQTTPRTGTTCFYIGENGNLKRVLAAPASSVGIGQAVRLQQYPTGFFTQIANLQAEDGGEQVHYVITPNGSISVRRGGTILGTSNPCIKPLTWHWTEILTTIDPVHGYVEVRVDGTPVLIITDANTQGGDTLNIGSVNWFIAAIALGASPIWIDDLVIWDTSGGINNTFLGDRRCITFFPNADSAPLNWTPSTGVTNYACVDNPTVDDTKYIFTSNVGDKSTFTFPGLPANAQDIAGIVMFSRSQKTDAGAASILTSFITGLSEQDGPSLAQNIGFGYGITVFNSNPLTGVHYTPVEFNAGLIQVQRSA